MSGNDTSSPPHVQTEKWASVLALLKTQTASPTFEARFVGTTATLNGEVLTVCVAAGSRDWFENRLRKLVEGAVGEVFGEVSVVFGEREEEKPPPIDPRPQDINIAINLIADDRDLITYRPRLNEITGSVTATILLQQIIYWWRKQKRQPFYKFAAPCSHKLYKTGDSWREELGFGRYELQGALKKIGQKIRKGGDKSEALRIALIIYWIDGSRLTWFELNEVLVTRKIYELYSDPRANAGNQH